MSSGWTMQDLAKKIGDIDFTMFSTHGADGTIASRPMSNNGDVEYDGDSWFFTSDDTRMVQEIERNAQVGLSLQGKGSLLGKPGIFIAIEATAELVRDKAVFAEHWNADLERWFADGVDTPGMVLIKAHADRITYWDGEDEGTITL